MNLDSSFAPSVRVFVSSPGNLRPERLTVVQVCRRLSRVMGISVEPLLWEGGGVEAPDVEAFPASVTGEGPQAVVDRRVWDELGGYDVYVGMIWYRMGTPTQGWRSGTEAEYRSAVQWHRESVRPSTILFYRKTADVPADVDPDQLAKAQDFIAELEKAGLPQRFADRATLENHLYTHLSDAVRKVMPTNLSSTTAVQGTSANAILAPSSEIANLLSRVPPTVAAELNLAMNQDPGEAVQLLRHFADESTPPEQTVDQLMAGRPTWLAQSTSLHLWVAVGEFAQMHGVAEAACDAFVEAANLGRPDTPKWLAKAARGAAAAGRLEYTRELLEKARNLVGGSHPYVELVEAAVKADAHAILQAAAEFEGDDPFVRLMRAVALELLERIDDALAEYEAVSIDHPENATAVLSVSRLLLAREERGMSESPIADLERAKKQALQARDLRRRWRGDSAEAAELAASAAMRSRDYRDALNIALRPPEGEATDAEASNENVLQRASYAAVLTGDPRRGLELAEQVVDPVGRALTEAACWAEIPGSNDLVKAAYRRALELATGLNQRLEAYYGLASTGEWPLPGFEELAQRDPEEADLITAEAEMARGDVEGAIRRCLKWRNSRRALEALVDFYRRAERFDEAVEALREGARRHGDPRLSIRSSRMLASEGRYEEAEREAQAAMEAVPAGSHPYRVLRYLRLELASLRGDWSSVERQARAGIGEGMDTQDMRWALVFSLYNTRRFEEALAALTRAPELTPRDERQAEVTIQLRARGTRSAEVVRAVLDLADQFPESEQVNAAAFAVALDVSRDVELPISVLGQLRTLTEAFFERFPESTTWVRVDATDPEALKTFLEETLSSGAQQYDKVLRDVFFGRLPYGFLSLIAGRSYTEALIKRAAGFLPVASADDDVAALEQDVASRAQGGDVVIEASTLNILDLLGLDPADLLANFGRVRFPSESLDDAIEGRESLNLRATAVVDWDARSNQPVFREIPEESAEEWANAADRLLRRARTCDIVSLNTEEAFEHSNAKGVRPWLAPIVLAKQRSLPLFSDDFVLRAIARSEGVEAFGTLNLLYSLGHQGRVTEHSLEDALMNLRRNRAVDLPLDDAQILALGAENGWQPGPASYALTRPALWKNVSQALSPYMTCIMNVLSTDGSLLPDWCHAASVGLAGNSPPAVVAHRAGLILAYTLLNSDDPRADRFAPLLEASRVASQELGGDDPLTAATEILQDVLEGLLDPPLAAQVFVSLVERLDRADRDTALRIYLRPPRV